MIAVKKLDGSVMYLNEDLIERVEDGAGGQSAIYLINGSHFVVATESDDVVDKIRTEKAAHLRRVRDNRPDQASDPQEYRSVADLAVLSQVKHP